jgi:hypothetical protein
MSGKHSLPGDRDALDPEAFCSCGHYINEHNDQRCRAIEPEHCTCRGFRLGRRSKLRGDY